MAVERAEGLEGAAVLLSVYLKLFFIPSLLRTQDKFYSGMLGVGVLYLWCFCSKNVSFNSKLLLVFPRVSFLCKNTVCDTVPTAGALQQGPPASWVFLETKGHQAMLC